MTCFITSLCFNYLLDIDKKKTVINCILVYPCMLIAYNLHLVFNVYCILIYRCSAFTHLYYYCRPILFVEGRVEDYDGENEELDMIET
jgi:hypothetical protein